MEMSTERQPAQRDDIRTDWTVAEVAGLFGLPFHELLFRAHSTHRVHFDPTEVQISTLMSIKTGGCPEDCGYCPQSVHFNTGLTPEALVPLPAVIEAARAARERGATRFCMGAAYRNPKPGQLAKIAEMVRAVRGLGLETCATLGMLTRDQADTLRDAGLDYYNHNLDTSEAFYPQVISTRTYADRLETLKTVRDAGLKVCCGGIIGLGEGDQDRIDLLHTLATLPEHPESVPVNQLVKVAGTALAGQATVDPLTFVRVIAVARILMPKSRVRLSAGRTDMSDELQALCFFAGANSIFYGEQLLTTPNPATDRDLELLARLGLRPAEHTPATTKASASVAAG
ncbi:MAG: biotin synthase BioB [Chromatiales bacterium]|jgi:biotin synthase|nr:MAG: biotin synthase BioB [Chromatiales bacterium]